MSVLIWVQTVCKSYQQMTKVAAGKERVEDFNNRLIYTNQQKRDNILTISQ